MKQFTHNPEDYPLSGMNVKKGMYIRAENWRDFVEITGIEICRMRACNSCRNRKVIAVVDHKYNTSCNYCQTTSLWIVKGE